VGVLQRFERRIEGMVGLAFARIFKGKVHPAEIAKALQREADEQRSVMGEGRVLAPNVYVVRLGAVDYDNLAEWSDQLAGELADMVSEHIANEGYQTFDAVSVRLERDDELPTGVFEVSSHVADPARPAPPPVPPMNGGLGAPAAGHPGVPPLPRRGAAREDPASITKWRPPIGAGNLAACDSASTSARPAPSSRRSTMAATRSPRSTTAASSATTSPASPRCAAAS